MKLELRRIHIKDIQFGKTTKVKDGVLTVNKEELINKLKDDERIKDIKVDVARPGEKVRIIPVKDVIEPRVKIEGSGNGFPGVSTKMAQLGEGKVNILYGAAIVTVGDIVGFQEGVIDMWGEGAKWTPFSKTYNLVLDITPVEGLDPHSHEATVRLAGLKAAEFVGKAGRNVEPNEVLTYEIGSHAEETKKYPNLPKVLYVEMLISQGLLHDGYIYGVNSQKILPTLLHPNEELDGAVISGNCVAACDKITTYQHQNNSVILDLYAQHGKTLNFMGVILAPELTTLEGKFRTCDYTAKLCKMIGVDGVIISEEGYGNPDSDLLMICKRLENAGIKTVLITDECSGRDGKSQPLADTAKEAVAVVSGGNVSHVVTLPPADKVIGNAEAIATLAGGWDGALLEDGTLMCELNAVIGATSEIGYHYCTAKLY
ncbi:Glycine reductase complex component B subunits alpha and beta [[Clostridium] ultunense Esp]|uniref:Glycine reductase complex component B subunits alpha and beta n=1 Tax=[Clostridium] ultunense Esp TaxID=1288971 RepID=M1ZEM0_9FIRM|nr:glycine/sarcosine/betaine reductase component B subunit [Schnuerera ultunensis]CCQ96724.1 Glycine reductase complex component B subunits alpha and beta [[Clostridium] ultunense Esp]SHD77755.1 Glycine reductase complex component B subunits alpha and beta [[Clostridium] ultunense Esp]